jgi:transglutaminase-like putative cysteine protease
MHPRKGAGDEFYGIRDYTKADDQRTINWKLSARSDKVLINEYAVASGSKVTVRISEIGSGAAFEKAVIETASACNFYIHRNAEVRLETPALSVPYGRGLDHLDAMLAALARLGEGGTARSIPENKAKPTRTKTQGTHLLQLTYAGYLIIYASLFLVEEINPLLLYAAGLISLPAFWLDIKGGRRLPEFLWQIASVLILAYLLLIGWHSSGITVSNTHLLIFILLSLLYRKKSSVELRQIFLVSYLAFFLVSGQTISLRYFASFMLFTAFSTAWLLRNSQSSKTSPPFPMRTFAVLLPLLWTISGLSFLITPRLDPLSRRMNPFMAMGLDKRRPKKDFSIRFSENVSLGFFGELKRSGARVMRVRPLAGRTPPYLRIRGSALDQFDGRSWKKSKTDFTYRSPLRARPRQTENGKAWIERREDDLIFSDSPRIRASALEFTLFPLNSSVLFTVDSPALIRDSKFAAYYDHTDTLHFMAPYLAGIKYRYHGVPRIGFGTSILNYEKVLKERYLQVSVEDPRIRALAAKITKNEKTPAGKIAAIEKALRSDYTYSLYSDDATRDLSDFLFSARSGNCEYFATAAAILLRTQGIPTRLVTGFIAEEWNEYGKFFDVRQGQAHAWVEAYTEKKGWITVDPSPAATASGRRKKAWLAKLSRYYEALQFGWYRHIIGYDRFLQKNTFMRWGRALESKKLEMHTERFMKVMGWLILFFAILAGIRHTWQRIRRAPASYFERASGILKRAGLRAQKHQTPREFAAFVTKKRPDLEPVASLVEIYYRQKYSGHPIPIEEQDTAEKILGTLKERLATSSFARVPQSPE